MDYKKILITGGAGFIGSSLGIALKKRFEGVAVTALDNLKRRGSELNIERLRKHSVSFLHADLRCTEDIAAAGPCDVLIDCCAEPSVLAGYGGGGEYVVSTNLVSTANCLEYARMNHGDIVFLSTSRVYPMELLNGLAYTETDTRFTVDDTQDIAGVSGRGVNEQFPLLPHSRTLYGATKLASEVLVLEYIGMYGLRGCINRFGVIAGPWQMGKIDQGIAALWVGRHVFGRPLEYIGFGGSGKQVRDLLHIDDLVELIVKQISDIGAHNGQIYNAGGGADRSVSLLELTRLCEKVTGKRITITPKPEGRPGDVRWYVTDARKVHQAAGWEPARSVEQIVEDIHRWIIEYRTMLEFIL